MRYLDLSLAHTSDCGWQKLREFVVGEPLVSKNTKVVQLPRELVDRLRQGNHKFLVCPQTYANWLSITTFRPKPESEVPPPPTPVEPIDQPDQPIVLAGTFGSVSSSRQKWYGRSRGQALALARPFWIQVFADSVNTLMSAYHWSCMLSQDTVWTQDMSWS